MKKSFLLASIIIFLAGCTGVKQSSCLEIGKFEYEGLCQDWNSIPVNDQDEVIIEVADEIAKERGISRDDALAEILEVIEYHSGQ